MGRSAALPISIRSRHLPAWRTAPKLIVLFAWFTLISGCAAVESHKTEIESDGVGIVYHLPLRPIVVSVTPNADPTKVTIAVAQGDPEPDLSSSYLMTFPSNWLGDTHPNVAIDSQGLIVSLGSTVNSGVDEFAKSLGTIAGDISAVAKLHGLTTTTQNSPTCSNGQLYARIVHVTDAEKDIQPLCGYKILIQPLHANQSALPKGSTIEKNSVGVFYRLAEPYKVTLSNGNIDSAREFVIYAPDKSPSFFQPIPRTFFGNSTATLAFDHGILTSYNNSITGEAVAAAKLPADLLSAYFAAIGNIFSAWNTDDTNQKTLLQNQTDLAVQKLKLEMCQSAIAAHKAGDSMDSVNSACGK